MVQQGHGYLLRALCLLLCGPRLLLARSNFRAGCGAGWQAEYQDLHEAVLRGDLAPRIALVDTPPLSGLADSLTGIISAFYFALLTGRALLVDTQHLPHLTEVYSAPAVDWAARLPRGWNLTEARVARDAPLCSPFPRLDRGPGHLDTDVSKSLDAVDASAQLVRFGSCIAGNIGALAQDPRFRRRFWGWGLRPETAYGCAFHYLFALRPPVRELFRAEATALHARPALGLHLRLVQDADMAAPDAREPTPHEAQQALARHAGFFGCAHTLHAYVAEVAGEAPLWYFISDSLYLKKCVQLVYGERALVTLDALRRPRHVAAGRGGGGLEALQIAAGELWLFSTVDYHVISTGGFGRSGFLASLLWDAYSPENNCSVLPWSVLSLTGTLVK